MTLFLTEGYLKRQPSQLHAPHIRNNYKVYNDTSQLLKGTIMNPIGIVKAVSGIVVSLGVGAVVGNIIRTTTPTDINTLQKVVAGVGAAVVGMVVADAAAKQIDGQIDQIGNLFHSTPVEVSKETSEED